MVSRLLGLAREQLFAAVIGAGHLSDAFLVAFRIPNLLRDLFAEGALSQAFVPTFKSTLHHEGRPAAYALANLLASTLFVLLGVVVLVASIFCSDVVDLLAHEFRAGVPEVIATALGAPDLGKFELTVTLTRIMLPFLPIVSLAAVAMGMLNAQDRYSMPALAPAVFNVVCIAIGAALYLGGTGGHNVVIGWAVGTILAGLFQLGVQLPPLWRLDYRPRFRLDPLFRDPALRRIGALMLPSIAGLAAVQLNVVVSTHFASDEAGAVSWLSYAFRFLQFPIGVFGVAIGTVSATRFAEAAVQKDRNALSDHVAEGLRLVFFLCVPATVGLMVLDVPIIRLIFERGAFKPHATLQTARALELFSLGLVAYAAVKVIAPAFYAVQKPRYAVAASLCAVAGNLLVSITLHRYYGYAILALGVAAAATLNFTVLYVAFHRAVAPIPHVALLGYLLKIGAASAVMGLAVWGTGQTLEQRLGSATLSARLIGALVPVVLGALVYALICAILGVPELRHYLLRLKRRRRT
jgi:putative peptidoglycan lipid II flippase